MSPEKYSSTNTPTPAAASIAASTADLGDRSTVYRYVDAKAVANGHS